MAPSACKTRWECCAAFLYVLNFRLSSVCKELMYSTALPFHPPYLTKARNLSSGRRITAKSILRISNNFFFFKKLSLKEECTIQYSLKMQLYSIKPIYNLFLLSTAMYPILFSVVACYANLKQCDIESFNKVSLYARYSGMHPRVKCDRTPLAKERRYN